MRTEEIDMNTYRFAVERIDYRSSRRFEQTIAAFRQEVPAPGMPARLVTSEAQPGEIQKVVQTMTGSHGCMYFGR